MLNTFATIDVNFTFFLILFLITIDGNLCTLLLISMWALYSHKISPSLSKFPKNSKDSIF